MSHGPPNKYRPVHEFFEAATNIFIVAAVPLFILGMFGIGNDILIVILFVGIPLLIASVSDPNRRPRRRKEDQ